MARFCIALHYTPDEYWAMTSSERNAIAEASHQGKDNA